MADSVLESAELTQLRAGFAALTAEVHELRKAVGAKPRAPRASRWPIRHRVALIAGTVVAAAAAMGVAGASSPGHTADVTYIALTPVHKVLSNAAIAKNAVNSPLVIGGSTTVPTDATSVLLSVAVKSTAAGSLSIFPLGNPGASSADTIPFPAGNVIVNATTKQNPGQSSKVSIKNNGTTTATVTVTITGYSTQTTASNISGLGGTAGQVLTNTGTGAAWQSLLSDVTSAVSLSAAGASPTGGAFSFISTTKTVTVTSSHTAALVIGSIGIASSNGLGINGFLAVCSRPLAGGSLTPINRIFPNFTAAAGYFWEQSVNGVVQGLAAGSYVVGLCGAQWTSNMSKGNTYGSVVVFETAS